MWKSVLYTEMTRKLNYQANMQNSLCLNTNTDDHLKITIPAVSVVVAGSWLGNEFIQQAKDS